MVCINCGRQKTGVTNSRPHKTAPTVWRRRTCPSCLTVVTTYERVDVADQLAVDGRAFSTARLAVDLCRYLPDGPSQADEAMALAQTVGESLLLDTRGSINRRQLAERTWQTLARYNRKAGLKYGLDYDCVNAA